MQALHSGVKWDGYQLCDISAHLVIARILTVYYGRPMMAVWVAGCKQTYACLNQATTSLSCLGPEKQKKEAVSYMSMAETVWVLKLNPIKVNRIQMIKISNGYFLN